MVSESELDASETISPGTIRPVFAICREQWLSGPPKHRPKCVWPASESCNIGTEPCQPWLLVWQERPKGSYPLQACCNWKTLVFVFNPIKGLAPTLSKVRLLQSFPRFFVCVREINAYSPVKFVSSDQNNSPSDRKYQVEVWAIAVSYRRSVYVNVLGEDMEKMEWNDLNQQTRELT